MRRHYADIVLRLSDEEPWRILRMAAEIPPQSPHLVEHWLRRQPKRTNVRLDSLDDDIARIRA